MMETGLKGCHSTLTSVAAMLFLAVAAAAQAQTPVPTFNKVFNPDTIGPGSVAVLQFDIVNPGSQPVTDLTFTDALPAGMTIATPSSAFTDCTDAVLSAPDGGATISLSGGRLGASSACTVVLSVTAMATGLNTSGDLTSSAGNSGSATATLTVDASLPGFSKSFAPSTIPLGGTSTLTLTVDNSANAADVFTLNFVDFLPPGMIIATPANASTDCENPSLPASLTAISGTNLITLFANGFAPSFPTLGAGLTCTVTVDVTTATTGSFVNVTGPLLSGPSNLSSGIATATLDVPVDFLGKLFANDPVPPGGTVDLEFTVTNLDRNNSATNIAFTDDLDAALSGLVATGLPIANVCGAGSQLSGTGLLTLTGGTLPPGGSCTFSVPLAVPGAASTGAYPNTTSAITMDVGGSPMVGNTATDILVVSYAPVLTKEFTDDPVGGGGTVTLQFEVRNSSATSGATDIQFVDELTTIFGFPVSVTLPPTPCGAGSSVALIILGTDRQGVSLTGGNLGPGGTCTFDVVIDVPVGMPGGFHPNITSTVAATVGAETAIGLPAIDTLEVVGGPRLLKEFTDDPAQPSGTVTLEFNLTHDPNAPADATGITFTDDLDAALTGLAAIGLPMNDVCGGGSQLNGTTSLSFTGGTLAPGASCSFSVTLNVPVGAISGSYTNMTSTVAATVAGVPVTGNAVTGDLMIAGLVFSKEFTDDPVFPGGPVTLQFTIENISPVENATSITFTDDLNSVITGLSATGLPLNNICGAGSMLTAAGNVLIFTGGNRLAGESCTFSVGLQVPAGTASNSYPNVTSDLSATMDMSSVIFQGAADRLIVSSNRLSITKSFTDDPVAPGDTATLEFTITNLDAALDATGITFTDDLDVALTGLVATGLPVSDVCGAGSQVSGASLLTLTGGNLGPGVSCTFSVPVQVPSDAPAGSYANVTSEVNADMGGETATGDPAADNLLVSLFTFSKVFGGIVPAGGTTTLTFMIENLDTSAGAIGLSFADDLDAVVPGMVAIGLPAADVCGPGSVLSGTSILTLTGGELGPGGSCTFGVDVQVPLSTPVGSYDNTTSALSQGGIPSSEPATAAIDVEAAAAGTAIPVTTPIGTLILIALIAATAVWSLRWRV